jgi:arsenite methyltransferase
MECLLSQEDKKKIENGIREKYARVAAGPQGHFKYPTGRTGLEVLGYVPELLKTLPEPVLESYCGVGNPFSVGPVNKGEAVLDIGSGGGLDTLVAARMTGPEGKVVGLDFSPEMVARANENLKKTDLSNVTFREKNAEGNLPGPETEWPIADR